MKLFEEALVLSQLEHQHMNLKSRRLMLHEHVETQTQIRKAMNNQLQDMQKVRLIKIIRLL